VVTTIPENSGNLDSVLKYVQVKLAQTDVASQDFRVGNLIGFAHGIPQIATSSKRGDGRNERWIVKSHIELVTWNDVYN
jgi:hypothetical protein